MCPTRWSPSIAASRSRRLITRFNIVSSCFWQDFGSSKTPLLGGTGKRRRVQFGCGFAALCLLCLLWLSLLVGLRSHDPRVAIHRGRLNVLTAFPKNGPDAALETSVQGAQ